MPNQLLLTILSLFPSLMQIFIPRADTVSRLKLNKTDFENHILCQRGDETATSLISANGKVLSVCVCAVLVALSVTDGMP